MTNRTKKNIKRIESLFINDYSLPIASLSFVLILFIVLYLFLFCYIHALKRKKNKIK
jgi:hypothetical protein